MDVNTEQLPIHVEVFIVAHLLANEHETFSPAELKFGISKRFADTRRGISTHISSRCVANARLNHPWGYNYLWRIRRGALRLFRPGQDRPHISREASPHSPPPEMVPGEYQHLLSQRTPDMGELAQTEDYANWEVTLSISGPVCLTEPLELGVLSGRRQPYDVAVNLTDVGQGIEAKVMVQARTRKRANESAVFLIGQMLDVLCLRLDIPVQVGFNGPEFRASSEHIKRVVQKHEFANAFDQGREYSINRSNLARALSWYRKGCTSDDPIDKLLALWLSIEVVAHENSAIKAKTTHESEILLRILDCMKRLWGRNTPTNIPTIDPAWLDRVRKRRNDIAHGNMPVHIQTAQDIAADLPTLQAIAHGFLNDWEKLGTDMPHP